MKRLAMMFLLILALASVTACAPAGGGGEPLAVESGATNNTSDALVAVEPDAATAPGQTESAPQGQVVEVTPMSEEELAAQPPGQASGGTGAVESTAEYEDDSEPGGPDAPGPSMTYIDDALGFSVAHPDDFLVAQADPARLNGLVPPPSASVYFMSPTTAESALAGTDAPDLEVRVHEVPGTASLEDWLVAAGVTADQTLTPVTLGGLPGVEVCVSTMIVPQCSVFIAGASRVYQLRWLNLEGESMARSFSVR